MSEIILSLFGGINILDIILTILVIILLFVVVRQSSQNYRLQTKIKNLEVRFRRFMQDEDGESFENDIVQMYVDHKNINEELKTVRNDIDGLNSRLAGAVQKIGIVKYDAFNQTGGNMSYALVLLDENNDGVVLNTVQGANGCYSYAKIVTNGRADIELGKEERDALDQAMGITGAEITEGN